MKRKLFCSEYIALRTAVYMAGEKYPNRTDENIQDYFECLFETLAKIKVAYNVY